MQKDAKISIKISFLQFVSPVTYLMIFWCFYLNTEVATVNVVPKEQVPCCGWWSSHFKQLHKIKELPMDVPTHWKNNQRRANVTKSKDIIEYLCLYLSFVFCMYVYASFFFACVTDKKYTPLTFCIIIWSFRWIPCSETIICSLLIKLSNLLQLLKRTQT